MDRSMASSLGWFQPGNGSLEAKAWGWGERGEGRKLCRLSREGELRGASGGMRGG